MIQGKAPLMASAYAGKAGFSEPPPMGKRDDWANRVQVDIDPLRQYAQAVYTATDEELARPLDLTSLGFGQQNVAFLLSLILLNVYCHTGEISCLKGLQGLQGYPG